MGIRIRTATAALAFGIALTSCGSHATLTDSTNARQVSGEQAESAPVSPESTIAAEQTSAVASTYRQPLAPAPDSGDLRDVDLKNGIMFVNHNSDGELFGPVADGEFLNGEWGSSDFFGFFVGDPVFVDLDSDGFDEALVSTAWNGGGSGYFSELRAFDIEGDHVVEIAALSYGDRAFGGISSVAAAPDGRSALVDVFIDGDGACCPHTILQQRISIVDDSIVVSEEYEELRYVDLINDGIPELAFLPGTDRAVLALYAGTEGVMAFSASEGDVIEFTHRSGTAISAIELTHVESGQTQDVAGATTLAHSGDFELAVIAEEDPESTELVHINTVTVVEMSILSSLEASASALEGELDWEIVEMSETVRTDPGDVVVAVAFPSFPDAPLGSEAIAEFVNAQVQPWASFAADAEIPSEDQGGEYTLTPQVTLSSANLISVQFAYYEYLCCRPYPNHGFRAVVVEAATGHALTNGEIIDLSRQAEVEEMFYSAISQTEPFSTDDSINPADIYAGTEDSTPWSALAVSRDGLIFSTDRQGPYPGIEAFVPFTELGDLVAPDLLDAVVVG